LNSINILKINNSIPSTIEVNVSATRQDKIDNLLNELKLTKEENDTLKKEIARLKV
jgi:hypothetical protein